MMQSEVNRGWTLAILASALVSGLWWYGGALAGSSPGWVPLLLVVAPWVGAAAAHHPIPLPRTNLHIPLLLFLFTAAIGVSTAYDGVAAAAKFWVIVGAIIIFYALAVQPKNNLDIITLLLSLLALLISIYFLLVHNWQANPADVAILNRLGEAWMGIRPQVNIGGIHPNFAGGILAVLLPYNIALGWHGWDKQKRYLVSVAILVGIINFLALLLTSSRGGWLALAAGMSIWMLWLICGGAEQVVHRPRHLLYFIMLIMAGVTGGLVLFLYPNGLEGLLNLLPGLASGESRLEIAQNTVRLTQDYAFTGGGLYAFGGLYSQYMLNIPYFLFDYAHNMYLDILLEQGFLGLFVWLLILGLSGWRILPIARRYRVFYWATVASLITLALHGLLDDALYGGLGTPFLLIPVGIVALLRPTPQRSFSRQVWKYRARLAAAAVTLILLVLAFFDQIEAAWYANRGAVVMAQAELVDWPEPDDPDTVELQAAAAYFQRALTSNPQNRTANYRLGLLGLRDQQLEPAIIYLERAYAVDMGHRGLQKTLGYSYTWANRIDDAVFLLGNIPEAQEEMNTYAWWWGTQERADLAQQAAAVAQQLSN